MIISRLIKHGDKYHAILQDQKGRIHHKMFSNKDKAVIFLEGFYYKDHNLTSYSV